LCANNQWPEKFHGIGAPMHSSSDDDGLANNSNSRQWSAEMCDVHEAREIVLLQGWLSHTPAAFQRDVLDRCLLEDLSPGARAFPEGVPTGDLFGLVVGHIGVWIAHCGGKPCLVHFLRPGSWFESLPAGANQPRWIALAASRHAKVLRLPQQAMEKIVRRHPGAWRLFGLVMAGHLKVAALAADDLLIRDHVKRCVAVLLRLGGCRTVATSASMPIDVDVNQQGLATMSNLSRTTAGSILRRFEASGHLEVSYRHIRILAPDALRAMLGE
jgi:CRP/FNR family transcriptional regulator, cyclic AMP receptor protein